MYAYWLFENFFLCAYGLYESGSLKTTCDWLHFLWLYPKHMKLCAFSKTFGFTIVFWLNLKIISSKSLTIRIRRHLCRASIITNPSARSIFSRHAYISDCTSAWVGFEPFLKALAFFFSYFNQDERFPPCLLFSLNALCWYRLWNLSCGIRLDGVRRAYGFPDSCKGLSAIFCAFSKTERYLGREPGFSAAILSLCFTPYRIQDYCNLLEIPNANWSYFSHIDPLLDSTSLRAQSKELQYECWL